MKKQYVGAAALVLVGSVAMGCGSDKADTTSGAGGGGGTSSSSRASSGPGGQGPISTGVGAGGGAGAGGGGTTCLDPSTFADLFTIADDGFCAVALYTADESFGFQAPTWGTHDGPLVVIANATTQGSVDLERWSVPTGTTGVLTKAVTTVAANIPVGAFLGAQAVDLPFYDWTAISWEGSYPSTQGEFIFASQGAVATRYAVNGAFGAAGIAHTGLGRFLYTGLSALEDATADKNGLYAADACAASVTPTLVPSGEPTCTAPLLIDGWGDASGPVAVDALGNVFVVMSSFTGPQELHGFTAASVAPGSAAIVGTTLFTKPGFGNALVALQPDASGKGLIVFQPEDFSGGLDVIAQRYAMTSGAMVPDANTTDFLTLTTAGTSVTLMTSTDERIWAGVSTPVGNPSPTGTTFVVLAKKP